MVQSVVKNLPNWSVNLSMAGRGKEYAEASEKIATRLSGIWENKRNVN